MAAFDGTNFFAIAENEFTDTNTGLTYSISGNTAVNQGNSYEIYSNLGQSPYFEVPGGPTYYVNVAVADSGTATGNIYSVFPINGGVFTIPLVYTITVSGSTVTVSASTFTGGPTATSTLTAAAGSLTGGYFTDPVTKITYTCVVDAGVVTFVDSNNAVYPYPAPSTTNTFVASVVVTTAVTLAVDSEATPDVYPVLSNQFIVGTTTYAVNVSVAYENASGPYFPMVNGQFIVPSTPPVSNLAYAVQGGSVTKGYVISADDEFSADGNVVYTVNDVNVVRASNQATLTGTAPNQTLTYGSFTYTLDTTTSLAALEPAGLTYDTSTSQFTVSYNGVSVTYTVGSQTVTDNRHPADTFPSTVSGSQVTFTDTVSGITFSFDDSGDNQISVGFPYTNQFFVDLLNGITYYVDGTTSTVEAISYVPETTQYGFVAANGQTYLIHYNDVGVVFPVISGANVNAGIATVGSDTFTVNIDQVQPSSGAAGIPVNLNSFEINGNLYTITGTPTGTDYSACKVVGDAITPKNFTSANTFVLTDPTVTYTLQLNSANLPAAVVATFAVRPSQDLIVVNDDVYVVTYNTTTTGSLLGQGQASIAITNSSFTLTNPFDSTKAKFVFDDLDIYDAGSVVGQFAVYQMPTFFIGNATYTLNPVDLLVTDNNDRPYPLLPSPMMFSINGFNYVIDTNRTPHAIVGNGNVSPLSTDVTVQNGLPVPNSTFTLNGLVYAYVEDTTHNLLAVTGTKSYMIAQPALTFKLDSSLVFTISTTPPAAGNYVGTMAPIGTITAAGPLTLNLYAGTPESGNADFFTYKNVLYTLVESEGVYIAVQKTYTVYASTPTATQQQLAVFDLAGTTYMVTDGTTAGTATPAGINPGTLWAATSISATPPETQFGLVYGFTAQPISVSQSATTQVFQFVVSTTVSSISTTTSSGSTSTGSTSTTTVNTLYDIVYTPGSNANVVKVDVPDFLPTFTQSWPFNFLTSYPLTFETGGYNAFTTFVSETSTPSESFAGAYRTPVISTDGAVDSMLGTEGDFSLEFWHSLPLTAVNDYHPFTYYASNQNPLVYYVDVDFFNGYNIFVRINNTVMQAVTTPPVFTSRWRHFALTYSQPYVMLCLGAGFEVKDGTNYNFNRNFSIAMTFSVTDVNTQQGLLYKGTASSITSPELSFSYQVGVSGGNVTFQLTDTSLTDGQPTPSTIFQGPSIKAKTFYQVIIVKQTTTTSGSTNSDGTTDPYGQPFDVSELTPATTGGTSATMTAPPTSGKAPVTFSDVKGTGKTPKLDSLMTAIGAAQTGQSYSVSISVRTVNDDGGFGQWTTVNLTQAVTSDAGLAVNNTGSAALLIGQAYDTSGIFWPMGSSDGLVGNIQNVYLFNGAINPQGINTAAGLVDISSATSNDLIKAGLVGYWPAQYDPNGVVNNTVDPDGVAVSSNMFLAKLAPLKGQELQATSLYIDGYSMPLELVSGSAIPSSMVPYPGGSSLLEFNAGAYKLEEISMWSMCRQQYQVLDDMFGRLIPTNEPSLVLYLSASFQVQAIDAPILPMSKYIDDVVVKNAVTLVDPVTFSPASLDLVGSPDVGTCGPLVTPNLYTPPGVALTVCDTVPYMTTYSITLNSVTQTLAGEINEAYVYVNNSVLTLYAGKMVGELVLTWVSQVQGDVQLMGYVEGAPPAPMANLTNKSSYAGATSVTFTMPTSVSLKYQNSNDFSNEVAWNISDGIGVKFGIAADFAPFGFGIQADKAILDVSFDATEGGDISDKTTESESQLTSSNNVQESYKYTVKMEGTLGPFTGDLFMASLNTLTTPSTTVGVSASKTAILPNPNLGGFTTSNPPAPLPKSGVTEEKFGQRMYTPSPYGQAFVISQTLDVYQQTLLQTNTVYGYVQVPNSQIPPDLNIVSFRLNSSYIRPGCLDGVIGYVYNPASLPTGAQTYTTSTGEMQVLYDGNFSQGEVGSDASYMQVVEAYQMKKQIDQETFTAIAAYQTAYNKQGLPDDTSLLPPLDFYDEYVWSSRGATQEVKHTYSTSYEEVYTTETLSKVSAKVTLNAKLYGACITWMDLKGSWEKTIKSTNKYIYTTNSSTSFDVTASFDGIENDTQMRYASNNDAHFVMNNNSMFNPNNQSGLNLIIGSDGLVYNIVPSVSSGAGLPLSNNIDTSMTFTQPQPSYTSGNATGLTGNLEPYDRPGKTNLFRTYAFFLQPTPQNGEDFWNTVIDRVWMANSPDPDAVALNAVKNNPSVPWRLLYRVTYSERFLPPISTEAAVVPQITPVMAVPVLNAASDFLFTAPGTTPVPPHNPANDIEANIVLAAPTANGASAGTVPTTGSGAGQPILPNNVIPFDLVKPPTQAIVNWGDTNNAKLLGQLITSVLGLNVLAMSTQVLPGSTLVSQVMDPASGGVLYSIYTDPNGLTVNVPTNSGITVYQDVNGNPIQYYDGKEFHSLQADYIPTTDGTVMYYIQPPSKYDQSAFNLVGDYDLFGHPGDQWRYYLVSGMSANMTSEPTVTGYGPFLSSTGASPYTGFTIASSQHAADGSNHVKGYVLVQGVLQWPNLNSNAETFADVQVYKSMSLLDTFPIGDPEVLTSFLEAQYPGAPFTGNDDIDQVFARNVVSYFNASQQALIPE